MSEQYEVRLAGAGGQGLLLAGLILAEAAAIYDGKNAAQTQSYGPEARGGASRSEVIISDEEIDYPKVTESDLLLALSQEACDKYVRDLKRDGVLIVDTTHVHHVPSVRAYKLPITRIAEEATGRRITANIVALGVIVSLTKIVSRRAIEAAVSDRVPKGTQELNLKALAAGFEAAKGLMEPAK
ncbi:MAG: 2-oxoacid:acceptor oxidoreductase family protein [Chloroflexota bacterium]|nr:2-oxoacid:acceptor oxidoreductase family protein [Anaerolineae bacterium]